MDRQTAEAIIFDFDGTIADSVPVVLQIVQDLLRRQRSREDISRLRGKSSLQVLRELKVPLWQTYFLVGRVRRRLAMCIDTIPLIPGMDEAVRELAKHRTLYLVSANSAANVHVFLRRFGIDGCFAGVYGGVAPWRKRHTLARLARRHGLTARRTWYVGDEDLDIRAAHRAGMQAAAVAWGFSNIHVLKQQQPEALVFTSDELLRIVHKR